MRILQNEFETLIPAMMKDILAQQREMTPRAFFNRIRRHPGVGGLAEEVRDIEAPGVVKAAGQS